MKISKIYLRVCSLLFVCFLVCGSILRPVVTYASPYDLMINTDSNALMTLELDDSDYAVMPMSSLGSVVNTVDYSNMFMFVDWVYEDSGVYAHRTLVKPDANGHFYITRSLDNTKLLQAGFTLNPDALPRAGGYYFSFDLTSDFSYSIHDWFWYLSRHYKNANTEVISGPLPVSVSSGDSYLTPITINLPNLDEFNVFFNSDDNVYNFGGWISINFTRYSGSAFDYDLSGFSSSSSDYQEDVSGSLSDLSSSVDTMTDEISGVTEAIQNLQGAMEPHYSNVLTQLHHITEQLHAFYDQVYNNIHLAQMNLLGQIKEAIENIDLEVNISLDGLKQTIQQVGQNVITNDNKISSDQIANDEANTEEVKDAVKEHGNFIIDGLKGLFIPSDEFFKAYFDDLYSYFSDRFGFLSFPIDLLVRTVNLFINSSDVDAVLTLPSFEISGEQVWADQSFNFTEFMETNFAFLLAAIRTVTSIGMIYAFVNLCQDKWDEVMKS